MNGTYSTSAAAPSKPSRRRWAGPWQGLLLILLMLGSAVAWGQAIEPLPFASPAEEVRFQKLTHELRCPMCQNESLGDSNAPIARDLRHQIFQMMQQGRSDDQIKHYLVERYSDFVLYDPPLRTGTWLLWFGPLVLLLVGAGVVVVAIRRRGQSTASAEAPTNNEDDW